MTLQAAPLCLLLALVTLCACASRGHVPSAAPVGTFDVVRIEDTDVTAAGIDLEFTVDGRVTGSTGVNRCSGRIEVNGASFRFTPLITTRRAGPPAAMERERLFLGALARVDGWRQADGDLVLLEGGSARVRLTPR